MPPQFSIIILLHIGIGGIYYTDAEHNIIALYSDEKRLNISFWNSVFESYDEIVFHIFFRKIRHRVNFDTFISGIVIQWWNATSSHRFSITLLNKSNAKFLWFGHVFFFTF